MIKSQLEKSFSDMSSQWEKSQRLCITKMDHFEKEANKSMEATRRRLGDRHRSNLRTVETDLL